MISTLKLKITKDNFHPHHHRHHLRHRHHYRQNLLSQIRSRSNLDHQRVRHKQGRRPRLTRQCTEFIAV